MLQGKTGKAQCWGELGFWHRALVLAQPLSLGSWEAFKCSASVSFSVKWVCFVPEFLGGLQVGHREHSAQCLAQSGAERCCWSLSHTLLRSPSRRPDSGLGLLHRASGECRTEDHHNPCGSAAGEVCQCRRGPVWLSGHGNLGLARTSRVRQVIRVPLCR